LLHQLSDLDKTSNNMETSLRNELNSIRSDAVSRERRQDVTASEKLTQVRAYIDGEMRTRDNAIADLRKKLDAVTAAVENVDRVFPFKAPFDENGILYFIGTEGGRKQWVNPHDAGHVVASRSSNGFGHARDLVGRSFVNSHTDSKPDSWMAVDLGAHRSISPTHYCLRTRTQFNSTHRYISRAHWIGKIYILMLVVCF
jgi:hypothetical protein